MDVFKHIGQLEDGSVVVGVFDQSLLVLLLEFFVGAFDGAFAMLLEFFVGDIVGAFDGVNRWPFNPKPGDPVKGSAGQDFCEPGLTSYFPQ